MIQTRLLLALLAAVAVTAFNPIHAQDKSAAALQGQQRFFGGALHSPYHKVMRVRPLRHFGGAADTLRYWNEIAVNASGLDHTPVQPDEVRTFGEQLGPGRSSRAMAIVHIAMFDAVNSILGGYQSYTGVRPSWWLASLDAAVAQAAHDTLVAMFPSQAASFDQLLAEDLASARPNHPWFRAEGIAAGKRAAAAILAMRADDGSDSHNPVVGVEWTTSELPGHWQKDPISQIPIALGPWWSETAPFVLESASQFRTPAPPSMDSEEYTRAFNEVAALGGDGVTTPTTRTGEQTEIGIYWAYDGTPSLCAPPRLYNQIAIEVSKRSRNVLELARLLALVNVAMADAGVAAWESKYYYDFWRPVTGVREAWSDENPDTAADAAFTPLGAPASNLTGPNFTPPFPAYPSGHATFGGALFQMLRRFYGTDNVPFTFVSDELNGETLANDGQVRPLRPRSFSSFSQAEEENGQSRIYLGIHWEFDKTEGIAQGRQIADYVFDTAFRPARR